MKFSLAKTLFNFGSRLKYCFMHLINVLKSSGVVYLVIVKLEYWKLKISLKCWIFCDSVCCSGVQKSPENINIFLIQVLARSNFSNIWIYFMNRYWSVNLSKVRIFRSNINCILHVVFGFRYVVVSIHILLKGLC